MLVMDRVSSLAKLVMDRVPILAKLLMVICGTPPIYNQNTDLLASRRLLSLPRGQIDPPMPADILVSITLTSTPYKIIN